MVGPLSGRDLQQLLHQHLGVLADAVPCVAVEVHPASLHRLHDFSVTFAVKRRPACDGRTRSGGQGRAALWRSLRGNKRGTVGRKGGQAASGTAMTLSLAEGAWCAQG